MLFPSKCNNNNHAQQNNDRYVDALDRKVALHLTRNEPATHKSGESFKSGRSSTAKQFSSEFYSGDERCTRARGLDFAKCNGARQERGKKRVGKKKMGEVEKGIGDAGGEWTSHSRSNGNSLCALCSGVSTHGGRYLKTPRHGISFVPGEMGKGEKELDSPVESHYGASDGVGRGKRAARLSDTK